jgi:cob(I)alamin adenosyltransferase
MARNTYQKLIDNYKELMGMVEKAMDEYKITKKIPSIVKSFDYALEIVRYETDPKKVDEHIKYLEEEIVYYKNKIEELKNAK